MARRLGDDGMGVLSCHGSKVMETECCYVIYVR
jgi:hypothetical protein